MVTMDSLTKAAALAGALPGLTVTITGAAGGRIVVGPHPQGTMCASGLRTLLASWSDADEPQVTDVSFHGAEERSGMLSRPGERSFAIGLSASDVAACLRRRADWPPEAHVMVSFDELLAVSVVRVMSWDLSEHDLDEAALRAHATCLIEELMQAVRA